MARAATEATTVVKCMLIGGEVEVRVEGEAVLLTCLMMSEC